MGNLGPYGPDVAKRCLGERSQMCHAELRWAYCQSWLMGLSGIQCMLNFSNMQVRKASCSTEDSIQGDDVDDDCRSRAASSE